MSLPTPRGVSRSTSAAAGLAALAVGVAVWLSLQPHTQADLHRIVLWTSQWLHGMPLYGPESDVDYPPWAIVTLSPLALVPPAWLPGFWISVNLGALIAIARRLSRGRRDLLLLLVAAGAMRTLNQFSLVALALALAGTGASRFSPVWLGLSLMKPQIGAVFWLEALWRRQWQRAATAAVIPLLLTLVYAVRADVSVFSVPGQYAQSIALQYGDILWGQTELTSWFRTLWPFVPAAVIALTVAAAVFASVGRSRPQLGLSLASLLSLRHLSYDLILLLPWIATLEGLALWLGVGLLVADPAAVAGQLAPGSWLANHADRLGLAVFWVALALRSRSPSDSVSGVPSETK